MVKAQAALDDHGKGYGATMPPKVTVRYCLLTVLLSITVSFLLSLYCLLPPQDGVKPMPWTNGVQTLTGMGDPNGARHPRPTHTVH